MNFKNDLIEVLRIFLKLGLTSFGGPIAHIAYLRREFVERRDWLSEDRYAQLLTLCQLLPGPASSQMVFVIGLIRAGWGGALLAISAFTLPSAAALFIFASALSKNAGVVWEGTLHGLKLAALAIVSQALIRMFPKLCPDWQRRGVALSVVAIAVFWRGLSAQLFCIALGALTGLLILPTLEQAPASRFHIRYGRRIGIGLLAIFSAIFFFPLVCHRVGDAFCVFAEGFLLPGALVFGGGHVVLPLLEESLVQRGLLTTDEFLIGYGAAQAVPGPLFSLAAFLGARLHEPFGGLWGASAASAALFIPGLVLIAGVLPFYEKIFVKSKAASRAAAGANAAVVGLLAAVLYDPVFISAVLDYRDLIIALVGFALLHFRLPPLCAIAWCVCAACFGRV